MSNSFDGYISLPEIAKQRKLNGTLQTESNAKRKKQISTSKYKEISGVVLHGKGPASDPSILLILRADPWPMVAADCGLLEPTL